MGVTVTTEGGRPIDELKKLLSARIRWLGNTAEEAATATMMQVLVSLRALAKTAKPKKDEIRLEDTPIKIGWKKVGARNKVCYRIGKAEFKTNSSSLWATKDPAQYKNCKVWRWEDHKGKKYLVVATTKSQAVDRVYKKMKMRISQWGGLAKSAMTLLLKKTGSKTAGLGSTPRANDVADKVTHVTKNKGGDEYTVTATDLLDYAKLAFKVNGDQAIRQSMQSAANKIAATINNRCKDLLLFRKLDTPFPEARKK